MPTRLLDRAFAPALLGARALSGSPRTAPDLGYDAIARLTHLRDLLLAARTIRSRSKWKEPPVFFFARRRQADYEAAYPLPITCDPNAELTALVEAELELLYHSAEVRRVSRAIDGLRAAAESLASACPAANDLAELLAVPDDEVVLVLFPARRAGFRLAINGIADVGQFHALLANAVTGDPAAGFLPGPPLPARFIAACREVNPATPAGVPMIAEARWQMYATAALRRDGTLPTGMNGCKHWLWPTAPLARVPRVDGERVVLLGPPAFAATWDATRRFPELPAEVRLIEALSPFRVAERLSRLSGSEAAPTIQREPEVTLSKTA